MTNINRINLNLLRVLSAICEERSITLAGERLGLTQSAVSHALSQLRVHLDDELFVRTSAGMMPTPLAADIGQRLPRALTELEAAITASGFMPTQSTRTFHLACSDYTAFILVPLIMEKMEEEAPQARLQIMSMGRRVIERLDRGKLDLVVAGVRKVPEQMDFAYLFEEETVWVLRAGHPLAGKPPSADDLRQVDVVSVDFGFGSEEDESEMFATWSGLTQWNRTGSDETEVDTWPGAASRMSVPNFFAAAGIAASSDRAAPLPRRLAQALAPRFNLVIREDWSGGYGGSLAQVWHRAFGNQPPVLWFRELVARAAAELQPGGLAT